MLLDDLVIKVKEQFFDDQEASLINSDINFKELNSYDSLTGMAIITTLEEDFDIKISLDEYKKIQTVGELYDYIKMIKNI